MQQLVRVTSLVLFRLQCVDEILNMPQGFFRYCWVLWNVYSIWELHSQKRVVGPHHEPV